MDTSVTALFDSILSINGTAGFHAERVGQRVYLWYDDSENTLFKFIQKTIERNKHFKRSNYEI